MKETLEAYIKMIEEGRKNGLSDTAILNSLLAMFKVAAAILTPRR